MLANVNIDIIGFTLMLVTFLQMDDTNEIIYNFRPHQKVHSPQNPGIMLTLKSRRDALNILPIASLIFNFPQPSTENNTTLLSLKDVDNLFRQVNRLVPF